jgi:hypothetical protein
VGSVASTVQTGWLWVEVPSLRFFSTFDRASWLLPIALAGVMALAGGQERGDIY